ncbi:MAG: antitoxin [Actinomycetia bacterium]|nr:antitoxin [Actinomycetes bacterium]
MKRVLRGIDPELRSALETEAARLGLSLNALVLRLLRDSLGLTKPAGLHHDLDSLAGVWSREQAEEFAEAVRHFEKIDESLWAPDPDAP